MFLRRSVFAGLNAPFFTQGRQASSISVLLLKDVEKKGKEGAVIEVKRGFARNYLIPRKFAVYATKANQSRYTEVVDGKVVLRKAPANTSAEQIKSIPADKLIVQATTRQSGAIFVTPTDVRQMLEANGVFIDRRAMIQLGAPITAPGTHTVKIDGTDVTVQVVGRPLPRYN